MSGPRSIFSNVLGKVFVVLYELREDNARIHSKFQVSFWSCTITHKSVDILLQINYSNHSSLKKVIKAFPVYKVQESSDVFLTPNAWKATKKEEQETLVCPLSHHKTINTRPVTINVRLKTSPNFHIWCSWPQFPVSEKMG